MTDKEFLDVIYKYAENLKGTPLTEDEKNRIIKEFNQASGDTFTKAQKAVKSVVRQRLVESDLSKSANLDNTQRLLNDLLAASSKWGKK